MFNRLFNRFPMTEVMIVIEVAAILAAVFLPRIWAPNQKEQEVVLKAKLGEIRSAVKSFKQDCGDYPAQLTDLLKSPDEPPIIGGNGKAINDYKGPYMAGDYPHLLPINPVCHWCDGRDQDWVYDSTYGQVHVPPGEALDGSNYSRW